MLDRFGIVRGDSEALAVNLTPEDQAIQSMPDASPTKWHLAHTTWFFETFILSRLDPDYQVFDPAFAYLFNSYYEAAGPRHPRPERGLLSRPTGRYHWRLPRPCRHGNCPLHRARARAGVARGRAAAGTRSASRAAAPGTDPDGHQACLLDQSAAAVLSGATRRKSLRRRRRSIGSSSRVGSSRSDIKAPLLPSTTRRPGTRSGLSPSALPPDR